MSSKAKISAMVSAAVQVRGGGCGMKGGYGARDEMHGMIGKGVQDGGGGAARLRSSHGAVVAQVRGKGGGVRNEGRVRSERPRFRRWCQRL